MALQYATSTRNAKLDAVGTDLGANFTIKIFGGSMPANPAAADSGTLLVTFVNVNFAAASGGAKSLSGTPYTATASGGAPTNATHFRAYTSGGACKAQGTVGTSGADMTIDNASIAAGQSVTLSGWTISDNNA